MSSLKYLHMHHTVLHLSQMSHLPHTLFSSTADPPSWIGPPALLIEPFLMLSVGQSGQSVSSRNRPKHYCLNSTMLYSGCARVSLVKSSPQTSDCCICKEQKIIHISGISVSVDRLSVLDESHFGSCPRQNVFLVSRLRSGRIGSILMLGKKKQLNLHPPRRLSNR